MVDLGIFTDKLASSSIRVMMRAEQEAHRLGHSQITREHFLSAIAGLHRRLFDDVLMRLNRDPQRVLQGIEATLAGYKTKKGASRNVGGGKMATASFANSSTQSEPQEDRAEGLSKSILQR